MDTASGIREITIGNDALTVVISTLGAQMLRITDKHGRSRLWNGDPAIWGSHAPVLFPVAGGLTGNRYTYMGKTYDMGRHGFARTSVFTVAAQEKDRATFLLDTPQANYPFEYAFLVHYALNGASLAVTYEMVNNGDTTMYASVGAHEAYAIDGNITDWMLVFDKKERIETQELQNSLMTGTTKLYDAHGDTLPLSDDLFYCDTMVFTDLQSRGVTLRSDKYAPTVHVAYDGMDYLMIWKKPGANYVCIEPWCNPPEPVGFDGDITKKPGIIAIAPGEREKKTHIITFG